MKGDTPKFVSRDGRFVRHVTRKDCTPDGTVLVPEGLRIRIEEYGAAPHSGKEKVTVLDLGQTIRVHSFGSPDDRAVWELE